MQVKLYLVTLMQFLFLEWGREICRAIRRSNCFHKFGHEAGCHMSNNPFILGFGVIQVILSQIPSFHKLSILSIIAAIMSFVYSFVGFALSIAKSAGQQNSLSLCILGFNCLCYLVDIYMNSIEYITYKERRPCFKYLGY